MPLTLFKHIGVKLSDLWGRGPDNDQERKPQQNARPPELDKLWAKFNEKLNGLFRRGGGRKPNPATQGAGIAGVIFLIICFAVWMVSGTYIVQEGYAGLVFTFGKHTETRAPGAGWRWPYPFQSIEMVNVSKAREVQVGFRANDKNKQPKEALMLTVDKKIVDMQVAIQYSIKDPAKWVFNHGDQEETVRQIAESAIREVVGKNKLDALLYQDRAQTVIDIQHLMQRICDRYESGVHVAKVAVQSVGLPEQVQASYDDIEKAKQESSRLKSEAQAYANDVVPKAKGVAARLTQEAETYRARVTTTAEGDAARFKMVLAEYQKAPVVTRDRLYIETMQQIFSNTTKVLVDTKHGGSTLNLPLDKLMAQAAASEAAKSAEAAKPAEPKPVDPAAAASPAASAPAASAAASASASDAKAAPVTRTREARGREAR